MQKWLKKPWAPVVLLVVICTVIPLLLHPTMGSHVLVALDSPYAVYCCFIMPVLAAAVCVVHMIAAKKPALWLPLVVEVLMVGYSLAVRGTLFYAYDAPFLYYLIFYSIPAIMVFFIQLVVWILIRE